MELMQEISLKEAQEYGYEVKILKTVAHVISYKGDATKVIVPDRIEKNNVTQISKNAFSSNNTIAEVILPQNLKKIGEEAFYECQNLKEINLPNGEIDISSPRIFAGCSSLTSFNIPDGVQRIGFFMFGDTPNLN